ncbi:hypothetical protein [Streptomyces californicus]|uniref:hypothetical protein n=1 Tax=Streptomyces californicus TaxID=67351 RepID=UPI00296FA719|nr:hypothetical protein [Streptomyces californicus]MDW4912625.1 hypothetical protein [Streptomyces californicus]
MSNACPACTGWAHAGSQPGYDHIHRVLSLPEEQHEDQQRVLHGFATGFASSAEPGLAQTWVFFEHLEPALVFGRAGRMSVYDITSYGVYTAAREERFDHGTGRQVTTLHVAGRALDREPGEGKHFVRWARSVESDSAFYEGAPERG